MFICVECGEGFEDKHYPSRPRKFCSRKCNTTHQTIHLKMEYVCAHCGKEFLSNDARRKKRGGKNFCSRACQYKGQDYLKKNFQDPLSNHPRWKGGRYKMKDDYIMLTVTPHYPGSIKHGTSWRIMEHRKVMQDVLGRTLLKTETVHHKNGIRDDNRPENLELRSGNHGIGATSYTEDVNRLIVEIEKLKKPVQVECPMQLDDFAV